MPEQGLIEKRHGVGKPPLVDQVQCLAVHLGNLCFEHLGETIVKPPCLVKGGECLVVLFGYEARSRPPPAEVEPRLSEVGCFDPAVVRPRQEFRGLAESVGSAKLFDPL